MSLVGNQLINGEQDQGAIPAELPDTAGQEGAIAALSRNFERLFGELGHIRGDVKQLSADQRRTDAKVDTFQDNVGRRGAVIGDVYHPKNESSADDQATAASAIHDSHVDYVQVRDSVNKIPIPADLLLVDSGLSMKSTEVKSKLQLSYGKC